MHDKWQRFTELMKLFMTLTIAPHQSYYPQSPRKHRWRIWYENVLWILRFRELNRYYYIYGLDRKGFYASKRVLPYRVFTKVRDSKNLSVRDDGFNYAALLRDKFVFGQFLQSLHIPTPKNIAMLDRHSITWLGTMQTAPLCSVADGKEIDGFCKKLSGLQGRGAFRLSVTDSKIRIAHQESTLATLSQRLDGRYLLQERVQQHAELDRLFPHALNTMRIVTFNIDGKIQVFNAAMRIGTGKSNVDNWGIGGIAVAIDLDTGKLRRHGFFKPKYGRLVQEHPDTKVNFDGFQIPFFRESLEMVSNMHAYLYGLHSIGWDVAVSPTGPVLIEGNEDWDGSFAMAAEDNFKERFASMFQ
jgi:hypothetical protein